MIQVLGVKKSDQNLCQKVHSKAYIKDLLSGYKASSSKTVEPNTPTTNRQMNVRHAINDILALSTPAQPQSNQSIRQVSNCSGQHSSSSSMLTGPLAHVTHASVFQGIAEAPQALVSRILPAHIFMPQHTPCPPLHPVPPSHNTIFIPQPFISIFMPQSPCLNQPTPN